MRTRQREEQQEERTLTFEEYMQPIQERNLRAAKARHYRYVQQQKRALQDIHLQHLLDINTINTTLARGQRITYTPAPVSAESHAVLAAYLSPTQMARLVADQEGGDVHFAFSQDGKMVVVYGCNRTATLTPEEVQALLAQCL